MLKPRV